MKIMVGLMKADKGDVRINGYSISKDYEQAMKNVGCIIENVTPFPYLTAYENMKLWGDGFMTMLMIQESIKAWRLQELLNIRMKKIKKLFLRNETKTWYCYCNFIQS